MYKQNTNRNKHKSTSSEWFRMQSTHQASLNIPNLSEKANKCEKFPKIKTGALVSAGQQYDTGHRVSFSKKKPYMKKTQSN